MNENTTASLGLIGSVGFIFLVGRLFFFEIRNKFQELFSYLSVLNLSAVLVGTIGGFGSLIAFLLSPQIRSYNRVSIFIAFFSLFAVVLLLDQMKELWRSPRFGKAAYVELIILIFFVGFLDQTSPKFIPPYEKSSAEFTNDHYFINGLQSNLAKESMIFQLPVVSFPEQPNLNNMRSYEHFRGFLHSDGLRWSFGAMRGREPAQWQSEIAKMAPDEMVKALKEKGFKGLYIDRFGYENRALELERGLEAILNEKAFVSNNRRFAFFVLN